MNSTKILHLYSDPKFLEFISLTFDINGVSNTYINLLLNKDVTIKFEEYSIIIVHYLNAKSIDFLCQHKINKPVIWFFWGADGFSFGKFNNCFLGFKTNKLRLYLAYKKSIIWGLKQTIKIIFPKIKDLSKESQRKFKIIKKFSLVVPIMPEDYELLKQKYHFKVPSFHLNYINPIFYSNKLSQVNGSNILLGNSASFSNNHIEAIDWLKLKAPKDRRIIIPLSYGNKELASYIKRYAIEKLGCENIKIIDDFLSFDEYNKILTSCDIIIMNHKRQQALGNVVQALISGAHIYFDRQSSIYKFLKKNNVLCSEIADSSTIRSLNALEKESNRKIAIDLFGPNKQHEKVNKMIQLVV